MKQPSTIDCGLSTKFYPRVVLNLSLFFEFEFVPITVGLENLGCFSISFCFAKCVKKLDKIIVTCKTAIDYRLRTIDQTVMSLSLEFEFVF